MTDPRTIVVGGGIVGLSAAYFLARRGAAVTVLESGSIDDSASTGNAGLVASGHGPMPRPGLVSKALGWMLDPSGPLYVPPRFDPALLRWLWGFHRACRRAVFERNLEFLCDHGRAAGECFRALVEQESIDCDFRPVGQLEVYLGEAGFAHGAVEADYVAARGFAVETLDGAELRRREPAFRREVYGARLFRDRAFANPDAFVAGLAKAAEARGAEIRTNAPVAALTIAGNRCTGVRTGAGECLEADRVVLAAGAWSSDLARSAGVRMPMQAGKGYHVDLVPANGSDVPLATACVLAESYVAVNPTAGALRLAGTLEFSGINDRIVDRRLEMLRAGANRYMEGIDDLKPGAAWCGLRPCTADGMPVLGWAPGAEDLFIATGHAMMGFALGPLAGRLASEAILDGGPSLDVAPLSPDRFR